MNNTYEVENDLAVRLGLEVGSLGAHLTKGFVVIDLAVDGQDQGLVIVGQRLSSRLYLGESSFKKEGGTRYCQFIWKILKNVRSNQDFLHLLSRC
jgi:hypothetical protein